MPNSSSPAPSLSTLIQYTVIGLVVYILAGAPQLPIPPFLSSSFPSLGLGSSQSQSSREQSAAAKDGKAGRFQGDKIENLIHPKRNLDCEEFDHGYKTHVFSREPLVVYIEGFLSESERRRVVELR
jgi:prolyl 4-hydroxylase